MAQKITGYVKLQIPAGKATPAPPVGPALGQHGVNIAAFTKEFNERRQSLSASRQHPVPVSPLPKSHHQNSAIRTGNQTYPLNGKAESRIASISSGEIISSLADEIALIIVRSFSIFVSMFNFLQASRITLFWSSVS